jgi:hypothetical protein
MESEIIKESKIIPIILLSITFLIIAIGIAEMLIIMTQAKDWNNIRCQPHIMPFAGLYGYDINDNFNFCMRQGFQQQAGEYLGPVYKIFGGFVGVLGTLINSANSLRVGFSTFLGGFMIIIQEFTDRLKQFFISIEKSAQRIKMLMNRLYATFYAIIYMGTSGVKATQNFGGTVLFKFLDTFCFHPNTRIDISGKGKIAVKDVQVNDTIYNGSKITSKFQFYADGQPMVQLGNIIVSANHYLLLYNKWIRSDEHPEAVIIDEWSGGYDMPLICFNTEDHLIKIDKYIFRDYDETEEGDEKTEDFIERSLNGDYNVNIHELKNKRELRNWKQMRPAISKETAILLSTSGLNLEKVDSKQQKAATQKMLSEKKKQQQQQQQQQTAKCCQINLGDKLSTNNQITGIAEIAVIETVKLPNSNNSVTASTLIWNTNKEKWERAGDIYPITKLLEPEIYIGFISLPGSIIELSDGTIIRDYMEIASPFVEQEYSNYLRTQI